VESALRSKHDYRSQEQGNDMRYVYMALIALFAAIIILFKFQNLEAVTISLFAASITLPVSVLVLLIYVLGMLTGGFMLALVRTWVHGATRRA
jgi:lipopolysaccharide assembly protein A